MNLDITPAENECNIVDSIFVKDLLNQLPKLQKKVIEMKFIYDYSEIKIAEELHISRQAVNKAKNRGIKNLRKYMENQILKVS